MKNTHKGFTLIELLIVIGIIGLLAAFASIASSSARARSRDGKRIADLSQIQKALALGWGQTGTYPTGANVTLGGPTTKVLCAKGNVLAFTADATPANCDAGKVYMGLIPSGTTNPYIYGTANNISNFRLCTTLEAGDPKLGLVAGPMEVNESSSGKNVASCP